MTITTIAQLRTAIRTALSVFIQVRFGTSESWVRITKQEANALIARYPADATPHDVEMRCDDFGTMTGNNLYLG